jgi:hypothetical protein
MNEITIHSIVSDNKDILSANMDGEMVMMSLENSKYYNLGNMGSNIWNMLGSPISANQIIAALLEKYQVEQDQCEKEVLAFLNHLFREGLLKVE